MEAVSARVTTGERASKLALPNKLNYKLDHSHKSKGTVNVRKIKESSSAPVVDCGKLECTPSVSTVCALCKTESELQNSHIIPEFFFKMIYDLSPRRYRILSTNPTEPEKFAQKGLRERLLCGVCEQKFGRWENYVKRSFVDGKGVRISQVLNLIKFYDLDYKKFRLFQLSLLWRMSVSKLDFFKEVDLGPHEEKLRLALINDDPLEPEDYSFVLIITTMGGKFVPDLITKPSKARYGHHHAYWLVISGILYIFCVGRHCVPQEIAPLIANKKNEFVVGIDQAENLPFLHEVLIEFGKAISERKKKFSR
jgi:hypothetical protein